MADEVMADTGPLVACLDRREQYHEWAADCFAGLENAVVTCEAVVTEACFLLAHLPRAQLGIGERINRRTDQPRHYPHLPRPPAAAPARL